jgi:hypothetical protein
MGIPLERLISDADAVNVRLEIAPSFYLSVGVKDVLVLDPQLKIVYHHRHDGKKRLESPLKVELECGCRCEV